MSPQKRAPYIRKTPCPYVYRHNAAGTLYFRSRAQYICKRVLCDSPISSQKSPIYRNTLPICAPSWCIRYRRALYIRKRVLFIHITALYLRKRALHIETPCPYAHPHDATGTHVNNRQRAWNIRKRVLYVLKRTQYLHKRALFIRKACSHVHPHDAAGKHNNESDHTYESVLSHIWMSHVPLMIVSRHTYSTHINERIMSHRWMSHVTHINESCHTYEWVTSGLWLCHVIHINKRIVSHTWMSHVTYIHESCHTYDRVMLSVRIRHVTHVWIRELLDMCEWVMSHIRRRHTNVYKYIHAHLYTHKITCNRRRRIVAETRTKHITATHCKTVQHTATLCNTPQHTATHCNALQHTVTHCNTLQQASERVAETRKKLKANEAAEIQQKQQV